MHVGITHVYNNILYHNDVTSYYYSIKPINSLFAPETQTSTLIENMVKVFQDVNMPGAIIIKPTKINNNKIYKAYTDSFKKHGNPALKDLAKEYIISLQEILRKAVKYRYEIYFVFCDGRDELKKKIPLKLFTPDNKPLSKRKLEMYEVVNTEIHKKLCKIISAEKLTTEQVERLNQYLSIPLDNDVVDYYVDESPAELKYTYKLTDSYKWETLYSRTHVVSSFDKLTVANSSKGDDIINSLQLESYPSDVIIKFDLDQTNEFKKNMRAKKQRLTNDRKRFVSMADRKDQATEKAWAIAKAAEEVDPSIEGSKIKFQMFIRLRSTSQELLDKRSEFLRTKFDSKKIVLTNQIGSQISMANNLLPYRVSFSKYINATDLSYLARYNLLGGLYIGDQEEGMISTYTSPGGIPIFHDLSKPLLGQTQTSSPVTVAVGGTGAGKTQQVDLEAFQNMIFKGMKVLTIDPKGDRAKKIAMLGDNAAHLIIGSPDCEDGMFDPYLMNQDIKEALARAQRDIDSMARVLTMNTNPWAVERAHNDMLDDKKNGLIKKYTLTYLISKKLKVYDEKLAKNIMTLKSDPMMRLFFANDDTKFDQAFNLNKPYNLITFDRMPSSILTNASAEYDPNRMDNAVFSMILSRVQGIIEGFMKQFPGTEKIVVFDEYQVYKRTPGGYAVVDNTVRQARSWLTHVFLIAQELSSVSDEILNNVGEIYVGSLKSTVEIDTVLEKMKLENHNTIKGALLDRTADEGVSVAKKYNFLYQDYNNRKCLTKNKIPRVFEEVFSTLKDEEDKNILEKNVPVTGTKKSVSNLGVLYDD